MASDAREREIALMEAEMIAATDAYFKARHPMLDTIDRRRVFEAGFKAAWSDRTAAIEAARVEAEKLRADIVAVRAAGAMLSNCAFNLAQRNPGQFTARDIMALDDARKRWDEVLRSLAKEAPHA